MIPVCLAWGQPSVFAVGGGTFWGCQFDLLPGGTMVNASCTLHGLVGMDATTDPHGAEPIYRVVPGARPVIYAVGETHTTDLEHHQDQILQSFREHMARLGMAISG